MLQGKKTYLFFALALLVWLANQFGFGDFKLDSEWQQYFDLAVIVGGFVLRKITKTPSAL